MKKLLGTGLALGILGASLVTASPALADVRTWGPKSCVQGSVFVRTTASGTITHRIVESPQSAYVRTYTNGTTLKTNTSYSSYASTTSARADTNGIISSAARNCAD